MTEVHADASSPKAPAPRAVLLAGATGLVGRELLRQLLADESCPVVHALVRRPVPGLDAHPRLRLHVLDFTAAELRVPPADDVYIALGTTIKAAGSQAAFRRVDFDAVVNTARAARDAGATRLAVVSALGADARSRVFYNRVKGEMQQAVQTLGYDAVVIAQPSLLVGDRTALGQPVRPGERWAERLLRPVMGLVPRGIRPIRAGTVARALLHALRTAPPGVHVLRSADMQTAAS